jgi:hypothetical protein
MQQPEEIELGQLILVRKECSGDLHTKMRGTYSAR